MFNSNVVKRTLVTAILLFKQRINEPILCNSAKIRKQAICVKIFSRSYCEI